MPGTDAAARLVVLYDADCGFCSWCATALDRLDRRGRLRLLPLQRAAAELGDTPPDDVLLERMHVRDEAGRWESGGAALIRIAGLVPVLRPLAVAGRLPPVRWSFEAWYRIVARNRHRLGRLLGLDGCTYQGH
ncbi:MAG: DCC1-like thiol-disulfide oxidoreductase family protein [Chloroflexota bacterium]